MKLIPILFIICLLHSLSSYSQEMRVVNWKTFNKEVLNTGAKTKVINFWATWCGPCVQELPVFEEITAEMGDSIEVILVSLDNKDRLEEKILPFVARKQLRSSLLLLDDVDFNTWMPKINPLWGGEIPATLIIGKEKRIFHSGQLNKEELINLIVNARNL